MVVIVQMHSRTIRIGRFDFRQETKGKDYFKSNTVIHKFLNKIDQKKVVYSFPLRIRKW